jgi:hypothetical protein
MPHTRTAGAAPLAATTDDPVAAAARAGDEAAFAGLVDRYRRELHVHCYRMLGSLVREDIRITMPPHPWCYDGLAAIAPLLQRGLSDPGVWRLLPTRANRQPAAANYLRAPGDGEFRAFKLDVLRVEGGAIAEITTFDARLFPAFGLPPTL